MAVRNSKLLFLIPHENSFREPSHLVLAPNTIEFSSMPLPASTPAWSSSVAIQSPRSRRCSLSPRCFSRPRSLTQRRRRNHVQKLNVSACVQRPARVGEEQGPAPVQSSGRALDFFTSLFPSMSYSAVAFDHRCISVAFAFQYLCALRGPFFGFMQKR